MRKKRKRKIIAPSLFCRFALSLFSMRKKEKEKEKLIAPVASLCRFALSLFSICKSKN
jgi:hypothetical protein